MNSNDFVVQARNAMSFLVPVRNISRHFVSLKKQIEHNLVPGDEVIVVNDHSTDETPRLLNGWSKSNSHVNIIHNNGDDGLISTLNLGLRCASKDWIARFDADDLYGPSRLLIQSSAITAESVAIFSDYGFISEHEKNLGRVVSAIYLIKTSLSLVMGNRTAHPVVIFNRKAAIEAGGYRTQDYLAEDLSLWLRMSRLGNLQSVPEPLLKYRLNRGSVTIRSRALSQKMRLHVLDEIGLHSVDVENSISNMDSLASMYSSDDSGSLRRLLFLRDIQKSLELAGGDIGDKGREIVGRRIGIQALKSAPLVSKLIAEKMLRDIYRRSFIIAKH